MPEIMMNAIEYRRNCPYDAMGDFSFMDRPEKDSNNTKEHSLKQNSSER